MTAPRPFISYAHEDRETALRLYADLRDLGADPWLDEKKLLGGQKWETAIREAVRECTHFLALLSTHSVTKRGFVQKELKHAIDVLGEFPPGEIFLIPVRLEEVQPSHDELIQLHWIDLFPSYEEGLRKLAPSLGLHVPEPPKEPSTDEGGGWKRATWTSVIVIAVLLGVTWGIIQTSTNGVTATASTEVTSPTATTASTSSAAVTDSTATRPAPNPLRTFEWGDFEPAASGPGNARVMLLLGHADRPSNNRNARHAISEEQYLYDFAPELVQQLLQRGIPVSIQPDSPKMLTTLQQASDEIPIVIAMHLNSAPTPAVSGSEVLISEDADARTKAFAADVQAALVSTLGTKDRRVKTNDRFTLLRRLPRGVHLELFFLSNDRDTEVGIDKRGALAERLAEVIAAEMAKRT